MDILRSLTLLSQSIGFGANIFSIFMSPMAIALYMFGFCIFTIHRLIISPILGRASSDAVHHIMGDDKKYKSRSRSNK
jgi:hypothetical protein